MSLCGLRKKSNKSPFLLQPASVVSHDSVVVSINKGHGKQVIHRKSSSQSKFADKYTRSAFLFHDDIRAESIRGPSPSPSQHQRAVLRDEPKQQVLRRRPNSSEFRWAREDQLSVILENLSETGSRKGNEVTAVTSHVLETTTGPSTNAPQHRYKNYKRTRFIDQDRIPEDEFYTPNYKMTDKSQRSGEPPKLITPPPRDLESISRVDASLIFQHFTTNDAWELGSALRNRLLPIPTPVVINISLANQNQTLFHTCTHSGVMPDNDRWVSRKRKTVLRWGCSTWYMHCKFGGDEVAFRDKYGLGSEAGEYAIHGGGVPIRVSGVEGVVAVVVVSGLRQDEDHAVVVEVIRDLYY